MFDIAVLLFGATTLIALALSAWVPHHVELGAWFWALTAFVLGLPLAIAALLALLQYAGFILLLFVWVPIAAGWLLGLILALVVRFFRSRAS